jgi:hypothetical protein
MKLRFMQVYDQNGVNGPMTLQYWNKEEKQWNDVPAFRISYKEEKEATYNKNYRGY